MKAISLPQPWATLLAVGEKHYHTSTWTTDYRGPIAIHALPEQTDQYRFKASKSPAVELLQKHGYTYDTLPFGLIIAKAVLVAVHHSGYQINHVSRQERDLNFPHWSHRYMFQFEQVQLLDTPIPAEAGVLIWEWVEAPDESPPTDTPSAPMPLDLNSLPNKRREKK